MILIEQDPENCQMKEKLRTITNSGLYANSVNCYVGRPRSGKTFSAIRDIVDMIRSDDNVHLLVYINESGRCDDDTFKRFLPLINVPIEYVSYHDADTYLKELTEYKSYYNDIKEKHLESKLPKQYLDQMCEKLNICDFSNDNLHTLVLLEDATNSVSIKNPKSFVNDLLVRCAHTQISFFILIHFWKALTTNIKSNLSSIRIYPGYSRQQLAYMLYQMNMPCDFKELWGIYTKLNNDSHQSLFLDCVSQSYNTN
jgi:hypothetical protein